MEPADLPVACSLAACRGTPRRRRWQKLAVTAQESVRCNRHILEVRYLPEPGVRVELEALVDAERACCGFVDWAIVLDADRPVLRVTSRADAPADVEPLAALVPGS